jgi:hypothetical protein
MRKTADLPAPKGKIVRVMIYDDCTGVYLFLYDRKEDGPGIADYWFESVEDADSACSVEFGIARNDWKHIPDPMPDCQHDWISPTRIKCDSDGNKLWGQFEPANDAG